MMDFASSNASALALPPLPAYTLTPMPDLIPGFPDKYLTLIFPIIAYWATSMMFHFIDEFDLFPQYRLHTPAELLKRNRVTRYEVVRDVVIQQVIQTVVGVGLTYLDEPQMTGKDDYSVAVWGQRLRQAQHLIPGLLALVGLDSIRLANNVFPHSASLAGALAGGQYPWLVRFADQGSIASFAPWELLVAKLIYWVAIPAGQFILATMVVDTWQYFLHRAMHMNKWLYTTFHARHHRLYVPYAFGALYNHPFEGFLLDTLGTGIAYLIAGLSPRQCMWFFSGSTIKTVDDHCGYAFPWDPLQHFTSNNAAYHDVHHQSWGIKTNFSQPFFIFWDKLLGTQWTGGDVSLRYERARVAAQKKVDDDAKPLTSSTAADSTTADERPYDSEAPLAQDAPVRPSAPAGKAHKQATASRNQVLQDKQSGGVSVLVDETAEEEAEEANVRRSPRKKTAPSSASSGANGSLKGLRERVNSSASGGFHGRSGSIIGYDAQ